jgi:hypothetical protein
VYDYDFEEFISFEKLNKAPKIEMYYRHYDTLNSIIEKAEIVKKGNEFLYKSNYTVKNNNNITERIISKNIVNTFINIQQKINDKGTKMVIINPVTNNMIRIKVKTIFILKVDKTIYYYESNMFDTPFNIIDMIHQT